MEIIDFKSDLDEVEQFIQTNPTLLDIWQQIDTQMHVKTVKIENKNKNDHKTVIGNIFQKYFLNNKEHINKLVINFILVKMRDINADRKQVYTDPHPTDVQDLISEIKSEEQKMSASDAHGQTTTSLLHSAAAHPKPFTLNQMLTNSFSLLTLNPYIKTMIHINEFNN